MTPSMPGTWPTVAAIIRKRLDYIGIALAVFFTHGLLLLNDGIYWDDWLWLKADGLSLNREAIDKTAAQMGAMPNSMIPLWLSQWLGYRQVAFLSILAIGLLTYAVASRTKLLSRCEGFLLALITLTYPAFQTWIVFATTRYIFCLAMFLLACLLALKAEELRGARHVTLRVLALMSFFLSFDLNSLLCFYLGFVLVMIFLHRTENPGEPYRNTLYFLLRKPDYMILPIIFWIIKKVFYPVSGLYANYNNFRLEPRSIAECLLKFIYHGVLQQFHEAFRLLIGMPLIWIAALLLVIGASRMSDKLRGRDESAAFCGHGNPWGLALFGAVLYLLASAPYIAVGLSPSVHGWKTRHALLIGIPVGLLLLSIVRLVFRSSSGLKRILRLVFITTIVSAFFLSTLSAYLSWQARWVRDRSLMIHLAGMTQGRENSFFLIDDQYRLGGEKIYGFYEWTTIFKKVWGNERRLGVDQGIYVPNSLFDPRKYPRVTERNLSEFDPYGCQAILHIRRGSGSTDEPRLVARYYYYKYLGSSPQKLRSFLESITDVSIENVYSAKAVHCSRDKGNAM